MEGSKIIKVYIEGKEYEITDKKAQTVISALTSRIDELEKKIDEVDCGISVSYTHLDVYKRQV